MSLRTNYVCTEIENQEKDRRKKKNHQENHLPLTT